MFVLVALFFSPTPDIRIESKYKWVSKAENCLNRKWTRWELPFIRTNSKKGGCDIPRLQNCPPFRQTLFSLFNSYIGKFDLRTPLSDEKKGIGTYLLMTLNNPQIAQKNKIPSMPYTNKTANSIYGWQWYHSENHNKI